MSPQSATGIPNNSEYEEALTASQLKTELILQALPPAREPVFKAWCCMLK